MEPYISNRHDSHRVSAPELDRDNSLSHSKSGKISKESSQDRLQKDGTSLLPRDRSISKLGSQSDFDVSVDMFQKLSNSMQRQNIGAQQLKQSLDDILNKIHVEQWKNIPLPVCIATTALMTCVNDLKRFSLYMEHRFSNLTASTNQSMIDMFNLAEKLKIETELTLTQAEQRLEEKIMTTNAQIDAKMLERLAELKAESAVWAADKVTQEINILKPWIGKVVDDKIFASERKQTAEFAKKIKEAKDMFCVPELIGPIGCPFPTFQDFAQKVHDSLKELNQVQQHINANIQQQTEEQRQTVITLEESISQQGVELKEQLSQNVAQLTQTIKVLERHQERGFTELKDKLKEQDLGQDIRVRTKLICNDWNDKIMQIDVINQNGQKFQRRIDQLKDDFERIESQVAYQNTENEKIVFELKQQLEKQEQNTREVVLNMISQSPKGLLNKKTTIKSSVKPTEPTFSKESKKDMNETGTLLKSSDKSSLNDLEKNEEYKTKPKSLRKSSANKSSQSRLSAQSGSKNSQSSLKKKAKQEPSLQVQSSSVSQTIQQRVQSAKPLRPAFGSIKQQESLEQINYDQEINVTKNFVEIEDLTDRVRQVELQLIRLQRFQTNLQQKQARERKKQILPVKPAVDRSLAGILELGKLQLGMKQKSASNSPENRQQNAQLSLQQRGPLQWEAEKKRWVKEPMFAPDLNMKIDNFSSEVVNSRSRSREQTKNVSNLRDRISYQHNFDSGDRSQDLYSAESNAYVQSKGDLRTSKTFAAGLLLNNPSNQGFASASNLDKKLIASKEIEIKSDELLKQHQSVNQTQVEKQILQSHAQIYYMKDVGRAETKKRPLTGVRAQDLISSANNLLPKISDVEKSPRKNAILPQLREPNKLIGSKQLTSRLFKMSSAQV